VFQRILLVNNVLECVCFFFFVQKKKRRENLNVNFTFDFRQKITVRQ